MPESETQLCIEFIFYCSHLTNTLGGGEKVKIGLKENCEWKMFILLVIFL